MVIKLQDMLKKAESKKYSAGNSKPKQPEIIKPWQQGSVLLNTKPTQNIHEDNTRPTQNVHEDNTRPTQNIHEDNTKPTQKYTQNIPSKNSANYVRLSGHQKNILFFIYENCKQNRSLISEPISKYEISKALDIKRLSIHNTIQRLVEKGFLIRSESILGRGGLTTYELPDFIYREISETETNILRHDKAYTKLYTQSSYSSSINNNTTTGLSENWLQINFEQLKEIGFSLTQLKQLFSKNLNSPEIIQDSINHFAYALTHNEKMKKYTEPLNVLMGVLRKGQAWTEANYQSPQEIAQQQLISRKKTERARLKKLEEEAYKLALEEWQETLTSEQLETVAPPKKGRGDITPQQVKLSLYFRENIWPRKKTEYLVC